MPRDLGFESWRPQGEIQVNAKQPYHRAANF